MFEDRYIGEIVIAPYTRSPTNALLCDGRTLPIGQYLALFSVIGTQYGSNGNTTFNLPNFAGVFPMGPSSASPVGTRVAGNLDGSVSLVANNIPLFGGTAALKGVFNPVVSTVIKVRKIAGVATPSDGYLLGEGGSAGSAATIYVDPATTPNDVTLGGVASSGTVSIDTPVPYQVGSPSPVAVKLPSLAINFYMITVGLYPDFN